MGAESRSASSHGRNDRYELGVESICVLLHNLLAGGSARQWIRLLGRHVEDGGRATIVAPEGRLSAAAHEAGIEVVDFGWDDGPSGDNRDLIAILSRHQAAVVHWDHQVVNALEPAVATCGRAALAIHQMPDALARWFGPEILPAVHAPLEAALADPRVAVLVRGEYHRAMFSEAFDVPPERFSILPASLPLPPFDPPSRPGRPSEILALTRISTDKKPIVQLAVEIAAAALAAGPGCRLAIAGTGNWEAEARALCERRLPAGAWRIEGPPPDPLERLGAADVVVAQGLTTIEAAALGRPVVVARALSEERAGGVVLTPEGYDAAARDPFGRFAADADAAALWKRILTVEGGDLREIRARAERFNRLEAGSQALAEALATAPRSRP